MKLLQCSDSAALIFVVLICLFYSYFSIHLEHNDDLGIVEFPIVSPL